MKSLNLTAKPWPDYELLDSGTNRKLERYGAFVVIRPETQALWEPARPQEWQRAQAEFLWADSKGAWRKGSGSKAMPEAWELSWQDVRFTARLTSFKHTGVFPEQAANWEWLVERLKNLKKMRPLTSASNLAATPHVLNLFGYTGIASIVAAQHGAQVTHVDASKQSNTWAKENAQLSNVPESSIRYILDDALKFVEREVRRGSIYDGIILDPPAFGRGPKGEVWHIEEDLPRLLAALPKILSPKPGAFFLLNGYAAGYAPQSFFQAVASFFPRASTDAAGEFGELRLEESHGTRCISEGIYVRFVQ